MGTHDKYTEDYDLELIEELQRVNYKLRLGVEEVFDEIHNAYRDGELEKAKLKKELLLGRASLTEAYTRLGEEALRLNALHKAQKDKIKASEESENLGCYVSDSDARLVQHYLQYQREREEREEREKREQGLQKSGIWKDGILEPAIPDSIFPDSNIPDSPFPDSILPDSRFHLLPTENSEFLQTTDSS